MDYMYVQFMMIMFELKFCPFKTVKHIMSQYRQTVQGHESSLVVIYPDILNLCECTFFHQMVVAEYKSALNACKISESISLPTGQVWRWKKVKFLALVQGLGVESNMIR